LLEGEPEQYVARRDTLAKELRAAGDKEAAAAIKSLSKPTMSMWAVLAAGADEAAVAAAVDATSDLVRIQGRAADRAAITTATARRRAAIDALVAIGTAALDGGNDARSQEVRDLLERLTRHPELTDDWLAGTLRAVPDAGLGFEAFAAFEPPARSEPPQRATSHARRTQGLPSGDRDRPAKAGTTATPADDRTERERERRAREREREEERAERAAAKAELAEADKAVAAAQRALDIARRAKDAADEAFERASAAMEEAIERRDAARARR